MTIRLEVTWRVPNLRATASRIYKESPELVGRDPLVDVSDGEQFLVQTLHDALTREALEDWVGADAKDDKFRDCIPLRMGYWAQLVVTRSPRQDGNSIVSELGSGTLRQAGMLDNENVGTMSINYPSQKSVSLLVNARFLVDLNRS